MDPAYRSDPIGQTDNVHQDSIKVANAAYEKALKTAPKGEVVFLAGSPGAGKSSLLATKLNAAIVVDRTLANYQDAASQIRAALADRRAVSVRYIHRPLEETVEATLERTLKDKAAGGGRPVPVGAIANSYQKSRLNVIKLEKEFQGKIFFRFMDFREGRFKKLSIEEVRGIQNIDPKDLEVRARATAEKWFSENEGRQGVTPAFRAAALARRKKQ